MIKPSSNTIASDTGPDTRVGTISEHPSRFEVMHAVVFVVGFLVSAAGVFTSRGALMVCGGPCLIASALLSWLGMRVNKSGVVGGMMRAVLGPIPLLRLHLRNSAWVVLGVAVTLWGVSKLTVPRFDDVLYPPAHLSDRR